MNNIEIIVYLIGNLLRVYTIFRFTRLFFVRDHVNLKLEVLSYFIFYVINSSVMVFFEIPILNILTNVFFCFLITLLYSSKIQTKLISTVLIIGINILWDGIVVAAFYPHLSLLVSTGILTNTLFFLTEIAVERFMNLKNELKIPLNHGWTVVVIPVMSLALGVTGTLLRFGDPVMIFMVMGLLVINCFTLFIYEKIIKINHDEYKKTLILQQNAAYAYQFDLVRASQEEVRMIQHDLRNHLFILMEMIKGGRGAAAEQYINHMLLIDGTKKEYVMSGNSDIDSILNYKLNEAANMGANIKIDVTIPHILKIDPFYLNIILSNLIDNAIEALRNCDDKRLSIMVKLIKGVVYITVKNTYSGKVEVVEDELITTKKDTERHGIGLKSVKNAVEKYNGAMNYTYNDREFTVSIILYNDF